MKGRLAFAADAFDSAHAITAGQPYLLQCLCNRIFDVAARTGVRSITVDHVREASWALVADNEHFASLWTTPGRIAVGSSSLLPARHNGLDQLSLGVIQQKPPLRGEVHEEALISDLESLLELEIVDLHGGAGGIFLRPHDPHDGGLDRAATGLRGLRGKARAEAEDTND